MSRRSRRRGATLVLVACMLFALIAALAIAVDLSRVLALRSQAQTAADAGALAAAMELLNGDREAYFGAAAEYAHRNRVWNDTVIVDSAAVVLGRWDDAPRQFITEGITADNASAVQVTVRYPSAYYFAPAIGHDAFTVRATAVASFAGVTRTNDCVKPWGIPYAQLMAKLGEPEATRDVTEADIQHLLDREKQDPWALKFVLKAGKADGSAIYTDATGLPGNYYMLTFPAVYDAESGQYRAVGSEVKPDDDEAYRRAIALCRDFSIGTGDTLLTRTGSSVGPTLQGTFGYETDKHPRDPELLDGWCDGSGGKHGATSACLGSDGEPGVLIKAIFWTVAPSTRVASNTRVGVKLVASFQLDTIYRQNMGTRLAGDVVGRFKVTAATGTLGTGGSLLQRVMLVR